MPNARSRFKYYYEVFMSRSIAAFAIAFSVLAITTPPEAQAQLPGTVTGVGASFPSLVYSAWSFGYTKERGAEVRYESTSSGDGIKQMSDRLVDFGATDTPLSEGELRERKLIQFPTMAGGIVPVVNLKGVGSGALKLTGPVLAELFSGDIKNWDDPRIASLNPGLALPKTRVIRIARQDSSGSTAILTEYLGKHSSTWASTIGTGKKVKWSSETTLANGNDAVSEAVKTTPGSIGYVSFDRVLRDGLSAVSLRNKSGQFISPSEAAFQAAVKVSSISKSEALVASLVDLEGSAVWPIADLTYIILDGSPKSSVQASATAKFFYWAFLKGDILITGTGFSALPTAVQALVVRKLGEIKPQDGKAIKFSRSQPQSLFATPVDIFESRHLPSML